MYYITVLDTSVYRGLTSFHTTIYRKPTFTGVYLNWTSLTSRRYKISLIYCLLGRAWKICDEVSERMKELQRLKEILLKNEYPEHVIDHEFEKFIRSRSRESSQQDNTLQTTPDELVTHTRYIVLPFVSREAESFAIRLKKLVTTSFPTVEFNVAFKAPNEIGKFFPYKDSVTSNESRSSVVYRIKCSQCEASYIGQTRRHLGARVYEHRTSPKSAVYQHEQTTGHQVLYDEAEIIDSSESKIKLSAKEALHILKPSLNKQLNSQQSFDLKLLIIAAHSSNC